jgi:uncharacterized membrane protein
MSRLLTSLGWFDLAAVGGFVLLVLIGGYFIQRVRAYRTDEDESAAGQMTNFRDLHAQGVLSDEEYRTIKSKLSARLRSEINDANGTP